MLNPIDIRFALRPRVRSVAAGRVADLFGLTANEPPYIVADRLTLDLQPGHVALFVGPSGCGKSSLLRAVGTQVNAIDALALALPDLPLIDLLPGPLDERLNTLAACGLSEARLLLRTPEELSEGQRYRFRLAHALAHAPANGWLLADEFAAVLDRTLAQVVAYNVARQARSRHVGLLVATTHDDLAEALSPDRTIRGFGDGRFETTHGDGKKKAFACATNSTSPKAPVPTGRTSLGGITAPMRSPA